MKFKQVIDAIIFDSDDIAVWIGKGKLYNTIVHYHHLRDEHMLINLFIWEGKKEE